MVAEGVAVAGGVGAGVAEPAAGEAPGLRAVFVR
jgi:hypothetical protein